MIRFFLSAAVVFVASPAFSQTDKEVGCGFQSEVVDAVQKARLDGVKEQEVEKKIIGSDPSWPENYNKAIPLVVPWVYELPIKQVRNNDLGDIWGESCLSQ